MPKEKRTVTISVEMKIVASHCMNVRPHQVLLRCNAMTDFQAHKPEAEPFCLSTSSWLLLVSLMGFVEVTFKVASSGDTHQAVHARIICVVRTAVNNIGLFCKPHAIRSNVTKLPQQAEA